MFFISMKKAIFAASFTMSGLAFSGISTTAIMQNKSHITISVETEIRNKMCQTDPVDVKITKPIMNRNNRTKTAGKISVTFRTSPNQICLMAFGPHKGSITFQKGEQLPQLSVGTYKLEINGVAQKNNIEID